MTTKTQPKIPVPCPRCGENMVIRGSEADIASCTAISKEDDLGGECPYIAVWGWGEGAWEELMPLEVLING